MEFQNLLRFHKQFVRCVSSLQQPTPVFRSLGERMKRNAHSWLELEPAVIRISDQLSSCFGHWDKRIQETVKEKKGRK